MRLTYSELREKDVIDVCTGKRVGFVDDLVLDTDCGRVVELSVSPHYFTLTQKAAARVPWSEIVCVGEDAVLVKGEGIRDCQKPPKRIFKTG